MDYNSKLRFCVYCHTSPSGKKYFGKTFGLTEDDANRNRWNDGKSYTHQFEDGSFEYPAFGPAIIKYGWDNFTHEIVISGITEEAAYHFEREFATYYRSIGMSYNCTNGGEGSSGRLVKQSTRDLISQKNSGRKHSEEEKRNRAEGGRRFRENNPNWSKEVLGPAISRGIKNSDYVRTEEHCRNLGESIRRGYTNGSIVSPLKGTVNDALRQRDLENNPVYIPGVKEKIGLANTKTYVLSNGWEGTAKELGSMFADYFNKPHYANCMYDWRLNATEDKRRVPQCVLKVFPDLHVISKERHNNLNEKYLELCQHM